MAADDGKCEDGREQGDSREQEDGREQGDSREREDGREQGDSRDRDDGREGDDGRRTGVPPATSTGGSEPGHTRRGVRRTFDRIADHFSATREHAWPEVEAFVAGQAGDDPVGTALDLGCGNGRHAELLADRATRVVGLDASRDLLRAAAGRASERDFDLDPVQADAVRVPLADDCVALAVYVATLHHLPSEEARRASLAELARVLAPGGRALVSAWSATHRRFEGRAAGDRTTGFDTTVDWTLPGGETVPRFYHIYAPDEFRAALEASALDVVECEVSSGNCYAVVTA